MNRVIRLAACGALFSVLFSVKPAAAQDAAVIKELSRLEDVWAAAATKKDGAAVGRLVSPRFLSMDESDGTVVDKGTLVNAVTTTKRSRTFTNGSYKGEVFGNIAIIAGLTTIVEKTATGSASHRNAWTDTWMKQPDGQWLCIASQAAHLAK